MSTVVASPTSLDVPSWIQAATAIGAIFVAYWVARRDGVEFRRDLFAKRIQFALFTVEVIDRTWRGLNPISDGINDIVQGQQETDKDPLATLEEANLRIRKELIPLDRLRELPADLWPDAEMATLFKLDYERMMVVRRQSLPFVQAEHLSRYSSPTEMLIDFNNQFGELEYFFTGYFWRYVRHIKSYLDSPRAARLPRRYLQRVDAQNQNVVNIVLAEIERLDARKASS